MKKTFPLILAALIAASGIAHAQYTGPSAKGVAKTAPAVAPGTVKALLASGKDDTAVSLQGRIVRHLGGDKYRFADSTGEITVEIDDDQWPANTPVDDKVQVRIQGEFDKDLVGDPEVEVDRIEVLK